MWSSRLFWNVSLGCAGLVLLAALGFGFLVEHRQRDQVRQLLTGRLSIAGRLVGDLEAQRSPGETEAQRQRWIRSLGRRIDSRVTVIAPDGKVLADSSQPDMAAVQQMENHRDRPEVQQALESGSGVLQRYSETLGYSFLYVATRIDDPRSQARVVRVAMPMTQVQQKTREMRSLVWVVAGLTSVLAVALAYYLVARIVRPLQRMTEAAGCIAKGDLRQHVAVTGSGEIATLAKAFNQMSTELARYVAQLSQRSQQLETVLGGMMEGVIAVDDKQRILFANPAASELCQFPQSTAKGRTLISTVRNETVLGAAQQALRLQREVQAEVEFPGPERRTMALRATPLPGQSTPGVVLVFSDLTDLRRLESLRQDFVANVSHELKTPLTAIKAYAETLREGALHDPDNNMKFLTRIEEQADRLHQLILDLLSLARIESGREAFDIEAVDLADAVSASIAHFRTAVDSKQIQLQTAPSSRQVMVDADADAIRQILDNLIDNAIKYTPSGGRVTIRWNTENQSVVLRVEDTGVGIAPQHLPRLFERFYRVDKARSRELGGTGLGLSIVKHLVQFFGGSVGVESQPGAGSTFWIRLPLHKSGTA